MESNSCSAPLNNIDYQRGAYESLARHAKSFHWASRLFSRQTAADVAVLYAFCRTVDDIADNQTAEAARCDLANIRSDLKSTSSCVPVHAFINLARRVQINFQLPQLLVEAIKNDTGKVRIATWNNLIRYAYGVASTVGLMMCAVMGVRDPAALPYAVDLGIAMQLTNIARDVVEDAKRDRLYLPGEILGFGVKPHQIVAGDGEVRQRVVLARKQVLDHAALYYRSADRGMRFIPLRARLAVVTAARVYEAIGPHTQTESTWGSRAFVGNTEKIWRTLGALGSVLFNPAYWHIGRPPVHDAQLHLALIGLPGINRNP